jgi:heme exporter protein A
MNNNNADQVLSVKALGIRRSERWLFRDLDFQLNKAQVVQVVGQNGAGKTSLLRSICGLLPHAEGDIKWTEVDKEPILPIFLGHLPAVKPELTVLENLQYHPLAGKFLTEDAIEIAIEEVRLSYYIDTPARHLSAGQIRRVGLARLILAETACWILDEPFTSLDIEGCHWLEHRIAEYAKQGGSVIFTSHQLVNLSVTPKILELNQAEEMYVY